jgi:hypothetical protein
MTRLTHILALALSLASPAATTALAQKTSVVKFQPGNYGTMVSGTIEGDAYVDYMLGAASGQEMFVDLTVEETEGTGSVYFNVLPPGSSGEAIYNGSIDGNSTTVPLPSSGDYAIRVYQLGNDADAGKIARFRIDLSIQ